MRKKLQRGLCVLLCVVMAFSCGVVPAGAVVISPAIATVAKEVGTAVVTWFGTKVIENSLQALKDWIDGKTTDTDGLIAPIGALSTAQKTLVSEEMLRELAYEWNATCSSAVGFTVDVVDYTLDTGEVYRVIAVRRGYVVTSAAAQFCLADGISRILYCDATTELSGRWAPEEDTTGRHLLDYNTLYNLAQDVGGMLRLKDNFFEIYKRDGTVYCNVAGRRFSSIYESDKAAINQDRGTTSGVIIEGDTITNIENTYNEDNDTTINNDYSQDIDIENMTQVLPGGILNEIDSLIYDDNTKTYYVDSHDVTNNITNFYFYQYHINYTSVTYIGYTEEYDKQYELYYLLPDGRDSADLTAEELEQLNVDIDVIPYVRYSDNFDVRSLYHFDGDVRDSSYWNYLTSFDWASGASLTYMDAGAFNGALYLDENAHDFTMTLPGVLDARFDWTLQFRYYQSHTITPVKDSSVSVGGSVVMRMDGSSFYTSAGSSFSPTPVGTWNEICIVRQSGVLYYYVNGVYYASASDNINRSTTAVRFVFGDQQQTYKYLDEFRFVRGALYTPGKNYTPTAVPHDSNLSLVLPTGSDGIADETLVFTPAEESLLTEYSLDDWSKTAAYNALVKSSQPFYDLSRGTLSLSGYPLVVNSSYGNTFTKRSGYYQFTFKNTTFSYGSYTTEPASCVALPLFSQYYLDDSDYARDSGLFGSWKADQIYTFSVVTNAGSYSSITFRINKLAAGAYDDYELEILSSVISSAFQFSVENFGYVDWVEELDDLSWREPVTSLCFNSASKSSSVKYMELVEGSEPVFQVGFESSVYDAGELENAPILAVKTDVAITGSQIGGVRPSVPQKGQVWALVENGYITSLQQYTGSAWENVDGRIWTGSRWIPASSYNVITLQDMYDIVDATTDYEYIYTESGFWSWFQRAWKDLITRLDKILEGMGLAGSSCQHVYDSQVDKESTCTDPGHKIYTCSTCGHTYTELLDALGHDWIVTDTVRPEPIFAITQQPADVYAAVGDTVSFSVVATGTDLQYQWQVKLPSEGYWKTSTMFGNQTQTITVPVTAARVGYQFRCKITDASGQTLLSDAATLYIGTAPAEEASNEVVTSSVESSEESYDILTCSRCGAVAEDHGNGVVGSDGLPFKDFSIIGVVLDCFDGVWSVIVGVVNTAFGGLGGFVEGFTVFPDFFALYRPSNQAGVLGVYNYGGADIWD